MDNLGAMEQKPFGRKAATPDQIAARAGLDLVIGELRARRVVSAGERLRFALCGLALFALVVDWLAPALARYLGIG